MSEANKEGQFDCGSSPLLSGHCPDGLNPDYDGSHEAEIARLRSSRDRARRERDALKLALEAIRKCHHRDLGSHNIHVHGIIDAVLPR